MTLFLTEAYCWRSRSRL